jgi:hypothetical protein
MHEKLFFPFSIRGQILDRSLLVFAQLGQTPSARVDRSNQNPTQKFEGKCVVSVLYLHSRCFHPPLFFALPLLHLGIIEAANTDDLGRLRKRIKRLTKGRKKGKEKKNLEPEKKRRIARFNSPVKIER